MADEWIGRQIGAYMVEDLLGRGGMAVVYRARHHRLQRPVALKLMASDLVEDPTFIARFEREAALAARLNHPNVVTVHDFGEQEGLLYLVMALVDGGSLKDALREAGGPWPPARALPVLSQVAAGLDHAHDENLLHRDLKPANILVQPARGTSSEPGTPWVLLADFGIARVVAETVATSTHSLTGVGLVGSPAYMSPEQWRDERLDARSDVYAFSVLAYELLAGRRPFDGPPHKLMHAHLQEPPPDPRAFSPSLPPAVGDVLFQGLAKDREQRPWRASELVAALAAGGRQASIHPVTRTEPAPPPNAPVVVSTARDSASEATAPSGPPLEPAIIRPSPSAPQPPPGPTPAPRPAPAEPASAELSLTQSVPRPATVQAPSRVRSRSRQGPPWLLWGSGLLLVLGLVGWLVGAAGLLPITINAQTAPGATTLKGDLIKIQGRQLTLNADGHTYQSVLKPDANVTRDNNTASPADLRPGDQVVLETFDDGRALNAQATSTDASRLNEVVRLLWLIPVLLALGLGLLWLWRRRGASANAP